MIGEPKIFLGFTETKMSFLTMELVSIFSIDVQWTVYFFWKPFQAVAGH